ncbi:hypothetical protein Y024_6227 [Burkholderia pseudomallei TSV44]|nr:hypothetical protein Y024_6227 [Burkholderia pseudomallei TSV44]
MRTRSKLGSGYARPKLAPGAGPAPFSHAAMASRPSSAGNFADQPTIASGSRLTRAAGFDALRSGRYSPTIRWPFVPPKPKPDTAATRAASALRGQSTA